MELVLARLQQSLSADSASDGAPDLAAQPVPLVPSPRSGTSGTSVPPAGMPNSDATVPSDALQDDDLLPPLPSRVPQASLARELRVVPDPAPLPNQRPAERARTNGTNNAERSARVMSAFQHGTTEARHRRE